MAQLLLLPLIHKEQILLCSHQWESSVISGHNAATPQTVCHQAKRENILGGAHKEMQHACLRAAKANRNLR